MLPFDPSALAPQLAAMQQRERMLAELRRLDAKGGATDDNKAEIKELKRLLDEQRKQLAEQKKDQDRQKEIQNLLYEVSTELKDLDQRLKVDDQFEAAAKEFTDLYKRTNFDWILDHKNYDSLDFKELANKTGETYGALIKTPKLKILIDEAEAWLRREAEKKAKKAAKAAEKKREEKSKQAKDFQSELKAKWREEDKRLNAEKQKVAEHENRVAEHEKNEKTVRRVIHYPLWFIVVIVAFSIESGKGWVAIVFGWIPCWVFAYFLSKLIDYVGLIDKDGEED
jgi:hypothetical protein